jgi:RNA-directed DNA polymerase
MQRKENRSVSAPGANPPEDRTTVLQSKLYQAATREPQRRFHALYDKLALPYVLQSAWEAVRRNEGAAGIDQQTLAQIEAVGIPAFLGEIAQSLQAKTYRPQPVRRVEIPKRGDPTQTRPLGIPTVRDRVVQAAAKLVLEPIFEADFEDCSFGFRPGRSARQALAEIRGLIQAGYTAVYDADLQSYFDSIPHAALLKCLACRIADRSVLRLIRQWLQAPVVERVPGDQGGKRGGRRGTAPPPPRVSRPRQGTPQGGVISPLLANVYLHWFDRWFQRRDGPRHRADARLVRYADDFVILTREASSHLAAAVERRLEEAMHLTINRGKTRMVDLRQDGASLEFLGFRFRYVRDRYGRSHRYLEVAPSPKALARERAVLREKTGPQWGWVPVQPWLEDLNAHLRGWKNYFDYGQPRHAFRGLNHYLRERVRRHLERRSQRRYRAPAGKSYYEHLHELGLLRL